MDRKKPSRELSIGEIITQTFALYSRDFTQYLVPFIVAGAIVGLWTMGLTAVIIVPTFSSPMTPDQFLARLPGYLAAVITLAFLTAIVAWIIGYVAQGIAVKFTSDKLEKGQANLQVGFNFTISKLLSLLAVSIITGILIFVGLVALVIPGIILAIMFSLVVPTIMIEDTGALESLSRSRRLVSHRWLKTFALLLVLTLIMGVAAYIAGLIGALFGLAGTFVTNILTAFVQPILPIGSTLYYYSMIARTTPKVQAQPQQPATMS